MAGLVGEAAFTAVEQVVVRGGKLGQITRNAPKPSGWASPP